MSGDEPPAHARLRVDLLRDQRTQHERALRVADQDHAAALVVLAQVGAPGLAHVAVGDLARSLRNRLRLDQAGQGDLPVDRREDAAVLAVARRLVQGDRAQFGVDRLVGLRGAVVGHRRVDVEAVDLRPPHALVPLAAGDVAAR
jgi:hypothetical protein